MQPVKRCWKKSGEKAMKATEYLEALYEAATAAGRRRLFMRASQGEEVSVMGYLMIRSEYYKLQTAEEGNHADQE